VQPAEFGGDGFGLFWKNGAIVIVWLEMSAPPDVKSGGGVGHGTVPMFGSGPIELYSENSE